MIKIHNKYEKRNIINDKKKNKMIKTIIAKRYMWLIRENKKEEGRIKMIRTRDKLEREVEDKNDDKKVKIMINRIII